MVPEEQWGREGGQGRKGGTAKGHRNTFGYDILLIILLLYTHISVKNIYCMYIYIHTININVLTPKFWILKLYSLLHVNSTSIKL